MKDKNQNELSLENWPVEEGRYEVGNKQAPIAVCTEATVSGIKVDLQKVAIIGKCVTENIGIEKVVKNIVSNPYIRFLIVCGRVSVGHNVGQTILALSKNGVDKQGRVVDSAGSIPLMKHLTQDEVKRFQDQVLVRDLVGETDSRKIQIEVDWCFGKNPGVFTGKPVKISQVGRATVKCVKARPKDKLVEDPEGFFRIEIDPKDKTILLQHYNKESELDTQITGQNAREICETAVRLKLIGKFSQNLEHAMFVGRELEKAEIALKNSLEYKEDEDLVLSGSSQEGKKAEDEFGW